MPAVMIERVGEDLILRNKYGAYSKKELSSQIKEGRLTLKELGQAYHLRVYQIVHVLNSLGIDVRNSLCETRVADPTIDSSTHQVLLGTLLGDAYMPDDRCYMLGHGIDQAEYCYHVADRLRKFVSSIGDRDTNQDTKAVVLCTHRHDAFKPYGDRFYLNRKKTFTEETAPDLNPEGLAYWYMDDGKYCEYGAYLCVGRISSVEGDVLLRVLRGLGIEATFQNHDKVKGYHNLYVKAESRSFFFTMIDPYVIPSMRYKMTGESRPKVESYVGSCSKTPTKELYIRGIQEAQERGTQLSYTKFREIPTEGVLREMYGRGMSDDAVAKTLGFGRNRIASLRRSFGIPDGRVR